MSGERLLFFFFFEKTSLLGKIEGSRIRGKSNMRQIDCVKEAEGRSLQKLGRAVKGRALWMPLIHGVARSQGRLNST